MVARGSVFASALALSLHLGTPARGFQLRHGPVAISRSARRASCSSFPHMNTGKRRADASSRGWALGAVDVCSDELDSILPSIGSPTGEADNDEREKILENESPGKVLASSESESGFDRTSSYPAVPTLRECFAFTLPALGIYAAPPLMSLIDAAFIGRTSSIELNLLGDLVLVNGLGMGIAGAAWATSASQICSAGLLLRVLVRRGFLRSEVKSVSEEVGSERSTVDTFKTILGFVPFLFVMVIKIGMHNTAAATAASLGGAPAAAHTALFAIQCCAFASVMLEARSRRHSCPPLRPRILSVSLVS